MDATVTILKWEKHNPRKDVKRPSWFAFDNRMVEDDDFFGFNHGEFKAWIYLLSKASQKQDEVVSVNYEAAHRKSNIAPKDFRSAIDKLAKLGIVTVDVTDALRTRDVDVPLQTDKTDKHNKTDITRAERDCLFTSVYDRYPIRTKGTDAEKRFNEQIRTADDAAEIKKALDNYISFLAIPENSWRRPKQTFAAFLGTKSSGFFWRDWIDTDAGKSTIVAPRSGLDEWMAQNNVEKPEGAA